MELRCNPSEGEPREAKHPSTWRKRKKREDFFVLAVLIVLVVLMQLEQGRLRPIEHLGRKHSLHIPLVAASEKGEAQTPT